MSEHHSPVSQVIPENKEIVLDEHHKQFLSLPNKRVRTISESERIANGPLCKGVIDSFCRNKGHGFIKPLDGSEPIFVHICDIEGEWVPKEGDIVSYKMTLMPPKMEKHQALHVNYVHLKDGTKHEHWETHRPVNNGSSNLKHLPSE